MGEQEFKEYLENNRVDITKDFYDNNILHLKSYEGISKFKSVRRAIKRGNLSIDGFIFPKRPFNNRKSKSINSFNNKRKMIYERLKETKS